jgi:hypothetical protein
MDLATSWQDVSLGTAGVIGITVALLHGVLIHRLILRPLQTCVGVNAVMARSSARLLAPLLHFSTFSWFLGGVALVSAAVWLRGDARLVTCLLVGSLYLFGAIANLWATRGRHPGWIIMTVALAMIVTGARGSSA